MSVTAAIRKLISQGFSVEQALLAAEAFEAEMAPQAPALTLRQQRNKKYYDSHKPSEKRLNSDDQDVSDAPSPALDKEKSPTPPKEIKPTPLPPVVVRARDFDTFWALFPNKVGKRDAEREFTLALQRSSFEEIMAGLRRYVAKTDDRPWCNPSTFLHQNRWEDQPANAVPQRRSTAPPAHQGDGYNAVLNGIINGKPNVEYPGTTIDASYDRTDRGSTANLVQFDAFSKGH